MWGLKTESTDTHTQLQIIAADRTKSSRGWIAAATGTDQSVPPAQPRVLTAAVDQTEPAIDTGKRVIAIGSASLDFGSEPERDPARPLMEAVATAPNRERIHPPPDRNPLPPERRTIDLPPNPEPDRVRTFRFERLVGRGDAPHRNLSLES